MPPTCQAAGAQRARGRRRVLADWIASPDNPLTARVMVNRLWQHHFGRGLVATPSDFGRNGAAADAPRTARLAGRRVRRRRLAAQAAAQAHHAVARLPAVVAGRPTSEAVRVDPGNALLWRQNLRRLEAEAIRDAVLAVSGRLNSQHGRPRHLPDAVAGSAVHAVAARQRLGQVDRRGAGAAAACTSSSSARWACRCWRPSTSPARTSRSPPAPPPPSPRRRSILLNSDFMEEQAGAFADRLLREGGTGPERERRPRLPPGPGPSADARASSSSPAATSTAARRPSRGPRLPSGAGPAVQGGR